MKIVYTDTFMKSLKVCFSHNPIYSIPRWLREAKWQIKAAWHRVFKGYDSSDLWGFRDTFPDKIIATLDYLIHGMGHPVNLKNKKEWQDILREMKKGFKAIKDLNEMNYTLTPQGTKKRKRLEKEADRGLYLFKKYYFNLWD